MQPLMQKTIYCLYFLLHLAAIAIFLKGFFPVKSVSHVHSTSDDGCFSLDERCCQSGQPVSKCFLRPVYGRLVLVVVDALRADFVLPKLLPLTSAEDIPEAGDESGVGTKKAVGRMPYVEKLIQQNEAVAFLSKASPPTVTLPRIKAITTGTVPGFVDVILNFDSSSLADDNVVTQLYNQGRHLVFYGDETWLRLFPGHFLRSDGTTSFFVTDYTEVDYNVTRHLADELRRDDWTAMILHYLGLDHIGHLSGPTSPLVGPKLQEMDEVVQMLHQTFTEQDKTRSLPTLLVLCGDHGMSDQGSHGGSTPSEIFTPLVFLSSLYQHGQEVHYKGQGVQQIDLAPTMSLLLGSPIPRNSLGIVAFDALGHLSLEEKLKAAFINAKQLMKTAMENLANFDRGIVHADLQIAMEWHKSWIDAGHNSTDAIHRGERILRKYVEAMRSIQDMLTSSMSQYDLHAMSFGILILSLIFLTAIVCFLTDREEFCLGSYQKLALGGACGLGMLVHLFICTSASCSSFLCSGFGFVASGLILVTTLFLFMSVALSVVLSSAGHVWVSVLEAKRHYYEMSCVEAILFVGLWPGVLLHVVSLFSSSFVEEEHQTWYFLTVTILLIFSAFFALQFFSGQQEFYLRDHKNLKDPQLDLVSRSEREILYFQEEASKRKQGYITQDLGSSVKDKKELEVSFSSVQSSVACLLCAVLCRFARSWNQTGDKWSHLPDIGDWLVRPDNKMILSVMSLLSLVLMCIWAISRTRDVVIQVAFMCGAFGVYCYHSAHSSVVLPYFYLSKVTQGITEAKVVYTFAVIIAFKMAVALIQTLWKDSGSEKRADSTFSLDSFDSQKRKNVADTDDENRELTSCAPVYQKEYKWCSAPVANAWTNMRIVWMLVMMLLMRVHNLMLIALVLLQSVCLRSATKRLSKMLSPSSVALLYLWMGQAAFYYQGNSNSLATVDVASGYTGLDDYHPVVIGLQMSMSTYAGPIFWLLALMEVLAETYDFRRYCGAVLTFVLTVLINRLAVVIPYLTVVSLQRYHLFVWTVFSPKLLYEAMYSVVVSVLVMCVLAVNALVVR